MLDSDLKKLEFSVGMPEAQFLGGNLMKLPRSESTRLDYPVFIRDKTKRRTIHRRVSHILRYTVISPSWLIDR